MDRLALPDVSVDPSALPPLPLRRAVHLMLVGAAVQLLQVVVRWSDRSAIREQTASLARQYKGRALSGDELDRATSQAQWFSVSTGIFFTVLWLVVARLCATGRTFGRVMATFLASVYVFTLVFSGVNFTREFALSVVTACLGLTVIYLLWRRPVGEWMTARRSSRSQPDSLG